MPTLGCPLAPPTALPPHTHLGCPAPSSALGQDSHSHVRVLAGVHFHCARFNTGQELNIQGFLSSLGFCLQSP